MKVIIGKNPNTPDGLQILGESGADITDELRVKSLTVTADATELTKIVLEVYGSAEVHADNVTVKVN